MSTHIRTGIMATGTLALATMLAPASAQDFSLPPSYGSVSLISGFTPDPYTVQLQSGGSIDVSTRLGASGCNGFIANAPDFRVNYTSGNFPLTFTVDSATDTTLVINDPNGNWYCDDDGAGYPNPQVDFDQPLSGAYDVWVGTFGSASNASAVLSVTELAGGQYQPTSGAPDISLPPTYGSVNLRSGFTPDPYRVNLDAGGSLSASSTVSSDCVGMIAEAPDYSVTYTSGSLPLIFSVESNADTTLVINGADGLWYCDDDRNGNLNPLVLFNPPLSGRYDVWVGTFGGGIEPATLLISELLDQHAGTASLDMTLPPNYGSVSLRSGFTPDPYLVTLSAGGNIDASVAVSSSCRGSVTSAPDFSVNYTAGSLPLIFSVASRTDTTLVINGADGQWYCDDDGGNSGLNPAVRFNNPRSGRYDVWVGTYGGGVQPAELNISELYSQ